MQVAAKVDSLQHVAEESGHIVDVNFTAGLFVFGCGNQKVLGQARLIEPENRVCCFQKFKRFAVFGLGKGPKAFVGKRQAKRVHSGVIDGVERHKSRNRCRNHGLCNLVNKASE